MNRAICFFNPFFDPVFDPFLNPFFDPFFDPFRYWQGPTWVNTNWLIIDGLQRYGFAGEAKKLRERTLEMVAKSGFYEYFNPLTGEWIAWAKSLVARTRP